jgi:predicted phosphohydrolase
MRDYLNDLPEHAAVLRGLKDAWAASTRRIACRVAIRLLL